jgi:carbon monoxide dehydrogenase subunit G
MINNERRTRLIRRGRMCLADGEGAMDLSGVYEIAAPRQRVWEALTEADSLARILPGCEHLEATGENSYAAVASVKVGPIRARFRGKVRLEDMLHLESFRIVGSGDGGASGQAKGAAVIRLEETGSGTRIAYTAETVMSGKLAALGGRLVEAVSMRNIRLMMEALEREVTGGGASVTAGAPAVGVAGGLPASAAAGGAERLLRAILLQARVNGVLLALAVLLLAAGLLAG